MDNILVQNGQPTIIDWGLAVINENGGPITRAEFANNDVFWNEREGKPAMTANPLFNNPLVGAAFFIPAEPDDQVGIAKRQLQLQGRSDEAKIQSLLEDLQGEPHFASSGVANLADRIRLFATSRLQATRPSARNARLAVGRIFAKKP